MIQAALTRGGLFMQLGLSSDRDGAELQTGVLFLRNIDSKDLNDQEPCTNGSENVEL